MASHGRHLLLVTENVGVSRTLNFVKAAKTFFDIRVMVRDGWLWRIQRKSPPPLSWIVSSVRHLLFVFRLRHLAGSGFCYFQDLEVMGVALSKVLGFKTILDAIEPFSLAARDYPWGVYGGRPWFLWRIQESICYRMSDTVLVVCPEFAPWVGNVARRQPIVVENFPDVNLFAPREERFDQFSIVYFGGSSPSRSLKAVDAAIRELKADLEIGFHVIGPSNMTNGLTSVDCYHGYLSDEEAARIIGMCHVGLAPYRQNAHARYTLPNKTFQYAACGVLPVGPVTPPLRRFSEICRFVGSDDALEWSVSLRAAHAEWTTNPDSFSALREILLGKNWTGKQVWTRCVKLILDL